MHTRILIAGFALATHAIPSAAQTRDTIRVGSLTMFPLAAGVDTMDVVFEARTPAGAIDKRESVNISFRTREQLNGETVLHVRFGDRGNQYDFFLDPKTLATRRFEQHTNIDSAIVTSRDGCMTGWADMQNAARRTITCDRAADRFGGSPMDDNLIALLPLKAGLAASLATYGPIGGFGAYSFRVIGAESLQLKNQTIQTWRVERVVKSDYGTYTTTLWIDQQKHRLVQAKRDFGNGRTTTSTLRIQ